MTLYLLTTVTDSQPSKERGVRRRQGEEEEDLLWQDIRAKVCLEDLRCLSTPMTSIKSTSRNPFLLGPHYCNAAFIFLRMSTMLV